MLVLCNKALWNCICRDCKRLNESDTTVTGTGVTLSEAGYALLLLLRVGIVKKFSMWPPGEAISVQVLLACPILEFKRVVRQSCKPSITGGV
ncbi:hypothetical protein SKAU_G00265280 [Synaphobranchus kaupii]|uniref:Uncharacterized protein n=1 Tax=Synaphobranchus kaupii TaxID=118154 RepID=A0A9Q1IQ31_SYNKA|nr:hypothetical protein SKAU_G00265280 [Synaphobranchus kaupii]